MAHPRRIQSAIASGTAKEERLAIGYIRVSTLSQEDRYSLRAQDDTLTDYAVSHNIKIVDVIVEVASARKTGRTVLKELCNRMRKEQKKPEGRRIDLILVEKMDRLTRNHTDKETVLGLGVELHLVKQNKVFGKKLSAEQRRDLDDLVTIASHQSWNLGEEASKGMSAKAAMGIYPSNAPFGYRNVTRADGTKIIVPDPVEAPIVAKAFNEYARGNHSVSTLFEMIKVELHEAGVSKTLSRSTVADILKNPIYHGDIIWLGTCHKGIHTPIITVDIYNKVNEIAAENNRYKQRVDKEPWLFQGMIKCGHCGCAVIAERKIKESKTTAKTTEYIYYHCTGNKDKKCPGKGSVREEAIESKVLAILAGLQADENSLSDFTDIVIQHQHETRVKHQMQLERLQADLETNRKRQNEHYMRLLDGRIDQSRFDDIQKDLETTQHHLEEKIRQHSQVSHLFLEKPEQLRGLLEQAVSSYLNQSVSEKRRLLQYLLLGGTWKDGTLTFDLRQPFAALVSKKAA